MNIQSKKIRSGKPMSIEELKQRIAVSLLDAQKDRITENSKLMSEIEQWN